MFFYIKIWKREMSVYNQATMSERQKMEHPKPSEQRWIILSNNPHKDVAAIILRWLSITSNSELRTPDCFLWIDTPYNRVSMKKELPIQKWDALLLSKDKLWWLIKIHELGGKKYIKAALCCRWQIWIQWMIDFLSQANNNYWITPECPNYIKLLEYFCKRQGI